MLTGMRLARPIGFPLKLFNIAKRPKGQMHRILLRETRIQNIHNTLFYLIFIP